MDDFDFDENNFDENNRIDEDGLYSTGELSMNDFDDANIPVDIWFKEMEEDDEYYSDGFRYTFYCSNYMPRRCRVTESACQVYSKDKETIQKAIEKYILPLYQNAMNRINDMITKGSGDLYYWSKDD